MEHTLYPHWGGHSGYARLADFLDRARFRVQRHGAKDSHEECPLWLLPLRPLLVRAVQRGPMPWYKVSDLNAESHALRDCLLGKVDIVHFLDGEHSGRFLPRLLRRAGANVRTVATFHQPPNLLDRLLSPEVLRKLDHVVLMSPSQLPYFDQKVAPETISVIPHGIDVGFFRARPNDRAEGHLRCITVGRWLRDWRVFHAVARALPAVEFHVVADRETPGDDEANIVRHGGLGDEELASLYRASDILFLPLHDSTANNALLEGIASGLPTIVTDLVATRAYLADDEAIFIRKDEPSSAIAAIERLIGDPAERCRLGTSARLRAEALSWERIAPVYEDLYTRLSRRS